MPKKVKAKPKPAKRRVRHEPRKDANQAAFQLIQSIANRR